MHRLTVTLSLVLLAASAPDEPKAVPKTGPAAADLARTLLDDATPQADREAVVRDHPELSAELIAAMTADLPAGDVAEQYRRIPWVWRVAVAAGRRNDPAEFRRLLGLALPAPGGKLDDWRAVVLGGGLINGVTLAGGWPGDRLGQALRDDPALQPRWDRAEDLAAAMADDEAVRTGTRYDALRMLGVGTWDRRGAQLFRYLLKGVDPELQQGAIGGLSDLKAPAVAQALLSGLPHYPPRNHAFALDALLRDDARTSALLDALADGRLRPADLGPTRRDALLRHPDPVLKARAARVLGP